MADQRPPTIDPQAALRWQHRLPQASPWLHEEVARRMEERLALIRAQPQSWAHWEPVSGGLGAHGLLRQRYPQSSCHVVEPDARRTQFARQNLQGHWWQASRWWGGQTVFEPPADGSTQMVWANMALHMAADPQALMAQWHRALAVDGFVMFTCLGPDSLRELRAVYQARGWPAPSHEFTDMHDWGDMLVAAGFAEPVMDMERLTLTFSSPARLLEELRGLGRNLHVRRFAGLRGRQWYADLRQSLSEAPLQLTFELIYGHAFKPAPRLRVMPQSTISLTDMKQSLARQKERPRVG